MFGSQADDFAITGVPLERSFMTSDAPTVATCAMLESDGRRVDAEALPGVSAFLDGVQRSRVARHIDGSPIVVATIAAVVRERIDRRMQTWTLPLVRHRVLAARAHIGDDRWEELERANVSPIDVSASSSAPRDALPVHPLAVRARALELVAEERETLERRLAADWCRDETRWLWIDGGISGNLAVDAASSAFGVIKSHSTLYGDNDHVRATLALTVGERGPLFVVQHRSRRAIASWYLRVHAPQHGDPLHGLVRIELAPPPLLFAHDDIERQRPLASALAQLTQRADQISAWIYAERAPISLPDPRWDTLTYGVYACEQFLKATIGS